MTTISWPKDVFRHGGHWDTIRDCQMMVTTKKRFNYWSQSSVYEKIDWEAFLLTGQIDEENPDKVLEYRINYNM